MTHRYTYSAREMWWNSIMLLFEHLVHPEYAETRGGKAVLRRAS